MKSRRLLTLVGSICLTLVLAALLLPACAAEEPTPTPAPVPAPPAMEPVEWKFSSFYADPHPRWQWVLNFKELLEKRTDGLITLKLYPGQALFPGKEMFTAVATNACEIAFNPPPYSESKHPISGVFSVWGYWNEEKYIKTHREVLEIMNKDPNGFEVAGVKLLFNPALCDYYLISSEPIDKPEDMAGKLIRSGGGMMGRCIKAIGGEPAAISATEAYMALQRGTMDGGWMDGKRVVVDKLWEVAPHCLSGPGWTAGVVAFFMNAEVFNNLPEKYQKIVLDVSWEVFVSSVESERQQCKTLKDEIEPKMERFLWMSEAEVLRWRAKQDPVIEEYLKEYGEGARKLVEILKSE